MSLSMTSTFLPVTRHYLEVLSSLLRKAEQHVAERNLDPSAILGARLFPDMHPLTAQVQFACDFSKGAVARLAGVTNPSYSDDETSFADLQLRIGRTLTFIETVEMPQLDGSEERPISLRFSKRDLSANGRDYAFGFALPSVIFHVSIAYGILRHNGVEIGKMDFLGHVPGMSGLPVSSVDTGRSVS